MPGIGDELPIGDPHAADTLEPVAPEILPNVTVFPPREAKSFGIEADSLRIPLAGREGLAEIQPGHVLVSQYLFMRKAVSVERRGDVLYVRTEQAKITDAVKQGDFELRAVGIIDPETGETVFYDERDNPFADVYEDERELRLEPPGELDAPDGFGRSRQGGVGIEASPDGITGEVPLGQATLAEGRFWNIDAQGKLKIKPNIDMGFRPKVQVIGAVRWSGILPYMHRFKMYGEGTFSLTLGVEIEAKASINGQFTYPLVSNPLDALDLKNGARPRFTVPCLKLSGAIGIVPIWADICPSVDLNLEASAYGQAKLNASVNFSKTVGAGLEYWSNLGWQRLSVNPPLTVTKNVTGEIEAGIEASAGIEAKLGFRLYSIAGPFASIETGLAFERVCSPPLLKQSLNWETELKAGVEVDPPLVDKLAYEATLWENSRELWSSNGQCNPASIVLTYSRVREEPNNPENLRYSDLNLALDVPAARGRPAGTVSLDSHLRTVAGDSINFPNAWFTRADCSGCSEFLELTQVFPNADYKLWVYDYEAARQATDSMSRGRARVTLSNGVSRRWSYQAPGGVYNRWDVVRFRADANGTITPTALNTTRSVNYSP